MKFTTILLILALATSSCSQKEPVMHSFSGFAQGTTYSMIYFDPKGYDQGKVEAEVAEILREFDLSLSLYKDSSVLSMVNRNENIDVDNYFLDAFNKSRSLWEMTGGDFDITVGPLAKAWGFGPDSRKSISDTKRDSLLQFVGMEKVELKGKKLIKENPGIVLDFNAIAQGYSVDVICEYFDNNGFSNYLVEIGGEVRVRGNKTGQGWKIGIDRPADNNFSPGADLQAVVSLNDRSLATSGNYRKFYVEDGIKYSHTIDPHKGVPAKNTLLSATILATDCATADAIATACMVKGVERSIEFIQMHPEFDAYFIYSGDNGEYLTWSTESIKSSIEINQ